MPTEEYKWYPKDDEGQARFQENLAINLPKVATKYGVSPAEVSAQAARAAWIRYWVNFRANFKLESEQLTKYFNAKAEGAEASGAISKPIITPPVDAPPEIEGDVKSATYALRREIKNRSNYSIADGELLGFEPPVKTAKPDSELQGALKYAQTGGYTTEFKFSLQGANAIGIEWRLAGTEQWNEAKTFTNSPATLVVTPTAPNQPVTIEVRARLMKKNQFIGQWSPIYTIYVTP